MGDEQRAVGASSEAGRVARRASSEAGRACSAASKAPRAGLHLYQQDRAGPLAAKNGCTAAVKGLPRPQQPRAWRSRALRHGGADREGASKWPWPSYTGDPAHPIAHGSCRSAPSACSSHDGTGMLLSYQAFMHGTWCPHSLCINPVQPTAGATSTSLCAGPRTGSRRST